MANWYDTPSYYDIIFDQDTGLEADFLEAMMRRHGQTRARAGPNWRVFEPACGSGRLMSELAARGHEVAGFDLNPHMLQHARRKLQGAGLDGLLWEDRMESFKLPSRRRYDLAHCLVSTFKYLLDEAAALSHLERVAGSLRTGGLYVLGLHLTDYRAAQAEHERWVGKKGGVEVVCNTHTWPPRRRRRTEDVRTRLRITRRGRSRTVETNWQFRTYNAAEIKTLIARVTGFACVACHDFTYDAGSQRPLDDSYSDLVLILRKKGTTRGKS
jgi:SAM-dependent methyltransferase